MPHILILAYGNPLRSDDGVAWRAAEALQEKFPGSAVKVTRLHQLGPELAEPISQARAVIFVDASSQGEPGSTQCEPLATSDSAVHHFWHAISPAAVMALAAQLYGSAPAAFCATIAGQNFDHGESLSPLVEAAIPDLIRRVEELVHSLSKNQNS